MHHLNQTELARRLRVSPRTLERWRSQGCGPRFLKVGARCVYTLTEVENYEAQTLRQITAKCRRTK